MTTQRIARIGLTACGLVLALAGLHGPAARALPFPGSADSPTNSIVDWFSMTDPAIAFMTYLRLIAVGFGWYLLVLTVAHLLTALAGRRSALLDRLTPAFARPLVGLVITAATIPGLAAPSLAEALDKPSPPVTMVRLDTPPAASTTPTTQVTTPPTTTPEAAATMTMLGLGPAADDPEPKPQGVWEVAEGEHFWSIADRVLHDRLDRSPTNRELNSYWRTLIRANASRLVDPSNPDLLLVGQVLDLPDQPS